MDSTIPPEIVQQLKASVDLRTYFARYVTLSPETVQESSGPCPKCGGHDRFHVRATGFFCRACTGDPETAGWQDAISAVQWLHGSSFLEAVQELAGHLLALPSAQPLEHYPAKPKQPRWEKKQHQWQSLVARAAQRLEKAAGATVCAYLEQRCVEPETWRAWGLGAWVANRWLKVGEQWTREALGEAVVLPWLGADGTVKAVKYRLLDHPVRRYHAEAGGEQTLFGTHLVRPAERHTLFLVEGELNAISIWQVAHTTGVDVLSFGSEGGGVSGTYLARVATLYKQVFVWMDDPAASLAALEASGIEAIPLQSPKTEIAPKGLDANDLLQQGMLPGFLAMVRANYATTPAACDALAAALWPDVAVPAVRYVIDQLRGQLSGALSDPPGAVLSASTESPLPDLSPHPSRRVTGLLGAFRGFLLPSWAQPCAEEYQGGDLLLYLFALEHRAGNLEHARLIAELISEEHPHKATVLAMLAESISRQTNA